MLVQDRLKTLKAIELMFYGFEPTEAAHLKGYIRADNKAFVTRITPNVKDFVIELNDDALRQLDMSVWRHKVVRAGSDYSTSSDDSLIPNVIVNKDLVTKTIQYLYSKNLVTYDGVAMSIKDAEYEQRLLEIDRTFERFKIPDDNELTSLTVDKTYQYFNVMSSIAYQKYPEVRKRMHKAYWDLKEHFNLEGLSAAPVKDNRLYIGISDADRERLKDWYQAEYGRICPTTVLRTKYIVVSKNPYDYYFCSTGSTFQSCFSLSSDYQGWLGMVPMCTQDSHYIVYGVDDTAADINLLQGVKWKCPRMLFRCWGWTDTDGKLVLDKCYEKDSNYMRAFKETVLKPYINDDKCTIELKDGKALYNYYKSYNLHTYFDSIITDNRKFSFKLADGDRGFSGSSLQFFDTNPKLTTILNSIVSIDSSLDMTKEDLSELEISCQTLLIPKRCPITGLKIPSSEDKSKYARHLNCPLESDQTMVVLTYIDGVMRLETSSKDFVNGAHCLFDNRDMSTGASLPRDMAFTRYFSRTPIDLKVTKEKLKQLVATSDAVSLILLRVVEDDKVTFIKYKVKGVKA